MTLRRDFLSMTAGAVAARTVLPIKARAEGVAATTIPSTTPDAELIRRCDEHAGHIRAYNEAPDLGLAYDDDPLWLAYERSRDFVHNARPQTLAGMQAKARATKAEAVGRDGSDQPEGTPAEQWAWDLVDDLLSGRIKA